MATIADATVEAFVGAWNERDPAARLVLLTTACAANVEFTDSSGAIAGIEALSARIGEALEAAPGRRVERRGWLEGLGGRCGFRWRVRLTSGTTTEGAATVETDGDGRLLRVTVALFEPDAQAEDATTLARLRSWAVGNPLAVGSVFVLLVYLLLRFQTEHFYDDFGVTPEDAGFGAADLVVRQSTHVLLDFAWIGLIWSAAYLAFMAPWMFMSGVRARQQQRGSWWEVALVLVLAGLAAGLLEFGLLVKLWVGLVGLLLLAAALAVTPWRYPDARETRAELRSGLVSWSLGVFLFGSTFFGGFVFAADGLDRASSDAAHVRAGGWVLSSDYPWQARPATVSWKTQDHPFRMPACHDLVYLGQANDRVILYDRGADQTRRVATADVQLTFPSPSRCERDD